MSEQPDGEATEGAALARLEEQVTALRGEVRRLGAVGALPASPQQPEPAVTPAAYAWLGALEPPVRRRPQVPRMLLEGLFLAAAATVAAVAELDPVAIAGVMVGAWVIVALIEWAASRADRRPEIRGLRAADAAATRGGPGVVQPTGRADPAGRRRRDNVTEVTRLPAVPDEVETTAERRP